MYILIPQEEKRALKKEYRTRFLAVFMYILATASLIGIGALAPAYILSYVDEREANNELEKIQSQREERGSAGLDEEISKSNKLINLLKSDSIVQSQFPLSLLVEDLVRPRGAGVSITSITLSAKATSTVDGTVSGLAKNREALVSYRKRLTEDPRFLKVDLPVSDLAKSSDISFNLSISVKP